jgi:hypothetical protein
VTAAKGLLTATESFPTEAQPFTLENSFTTFSVEYTFKPSSGEFEDVHFHFFQTPETIPLRKAYWETVFPTCLDTVARAFFGYEYPRMQAQVIHGVIRAGGEPLPQNPGEDSWWLLVQQLESDDPVAKINDFFELLDQALESANSK